MSRVYDFPYPKDMIIPLQPELAQLGTYMVAQDDMNSALTTAIIALTKRVDELEDEVWKLQRPWWKRRW